MTSKWGSTAVVVGVPALCFALSGQASAAIQVFSGGDAGANSTDPRPISNATAASFDAAAGALGHENLITFESAPVGTYSSLTVVPGVTLTGTDYTGNSAGQSIRDSPYGNPDSLFGYNTTAGGANFAFINGGFITFSFATGIQAFGAYLTGLQLNGETVDFSDGTSQSLAIPNFGSGAQFFGFTDPGKTILSVEINTTSTTYPSGDYVGVDDLRYVGSSAVPEPRTWAMMLAGFVALGYAGVRRSRKSVSFAA